jgi:pantoate--beta-alanine ligase
MIEHRLMPPRAARSLATLSESVADLRRAGLRIGFAPTMGALHDGHAALVRRISARGDGAVASIFVNPSQFAPNEDLARYPRDEAGDLAILAGCGCAVAWLPDADVMYPTGFATRIQMDGPALGLETDFRPHFFAGVATVVAKLLLQVRPDYAVFGEKDYQQLLVVRRLVADLDIGVTIEAAPTVREADGLAMSSRNRYLAPSARVTAAALPAVLQDAVRLLEDGAALQSVEADARDRLIAAGFDSVDYVAVRDAETLGVLPPAAVDRPARILAAARVGGTRLIDNWPVSPV